MCLALSPVQTLLNYPTSLKLWNSDLPRCPSCWSENVALSRNKGQKEDAGRVSSACLYMVVTVKLTAQRTCMSLDPILCNVLHQTFKLETWHADLSTGLPNPTCFLVFAIKYSVLRPVVSIFGLAEPFLQSFMTWRNLIPHQPARHEVLCRTPHLEIQHDQGPKIPMVFIEINLLMNICVHRPQSLYPDTQIFSRGLHWREPGPNPQSGFLQTWVVLLYHAKHQYILEFIRKRVLYITGF